MPLRDDLLALAGSRNLGALVTLKRDGRPQLSNVNYTLATDPDAGTAVVRVSVTDGRAKVANLRRDPRASLMVGSPDGWSYAVLEGKAELSPVAAREDDATVEELVEVYRAVRGEDHPDWDDYRRAMVADHRLVLRLHVEHVYGLVQ
ncbi:PPOX class F420-dependent oxidoreductase [Phycicoccus sp. SLBN-51]|jgi:PPOX class probable F420-dependent enzyme|uniref:PPOX class F420-dependent oxidoreductase n=1 Tax=Phycicoccus sp. SLBN-51 TaxID=2768447 RepID=UPI00114EC5EF|nr:PPOX class F420-dependent oxidoreductase [Phycicoccus sp. SLBN-51]TQJ49760.1 PPOX class probable F420-dependent enzyme [Phycicoccus sp. SLBN-51]